MEALHWDQQGKITASPVYTSELRSLAQPARSWQDDRNLASINLGLLLSQLGLALAVGGQALEHRQASAGERRLFDLRGLAALLLLLGIIAGFAARALAQGAPGQSHLWGTAHAFATQETFAQIGSASQRLRALACWAIALLGVLSLKRFGGPYCGGSDLMTLQLCLCLAVAETTQLAAWRLGAAGFCVFSCACPIGNPAGSNSSTPTGAVGAPFGRYLPAPITPSAPLPGAGPSTHAYSGPWAG